MQSSHTYSPLFQNEMAVEETKQPDNQNQQPAYLKSWWYKGSVISTSVLSSIPSGVNSLVVATKIAHPSVDCVVGDFDCVLTEASNTRGWSEAGVIVLPSAATIANIIVGLVFLPPTISAVHQKIYGGKVKDRQEIIADNIGITLGIMSSVVFIIQGIDALTLARYFINKSTQDPILRAFGPLIDLGIMLPCSVVASVSTRLIGGMRIANAAVLWSPYFYYMTPAWMFRNQPSQDDVQRYANQKALLTFVHHLQYYFVHLGSNEAGQVLDNIKHDNYLSAVRIFYRGLNNKNIKPLHGFFSRVFMLKVVSYAIAVLSSWIMYNIVFSAFVRIKTPEIVCAMLGAMLAIPSFVYYIFALGRVVDQTYDTFYTIERFYRETYAMNGYCSHTIAFLIIALSFVCGGLSSGNFMMSGASQGSKGNYYYMIDSKSEAEFLFGAVGSFISGDVNEYSFLVILRRYFDKDYVDLDNAVKKVNHFIVHSRSENSVQQPLLASGNSQSNVVQIAKEITQIGNNPSRYFSQQNNQRIVVTNPVVENVIHQI